MTSIQYKRICDIHLPPGQSAWLWGAPQTGKTTLLKQRYPNSVRYDLFDKDVMQRFLSRPRSLGEELKAIGSTAYKDPVVIDEIQKVPALLDEVYRLIESERISFILCGSSQRKLKRRGINLLGGRAWRFSLYPLTWSEVPKFDLLKAMSSGLLPNFYSKKNHRQLLSAYIQDCLYEVVFDETLVKKPEAFLRFLDELPYLHGELLNYSWIAQDCGINKKTVQNYFDILVDSLMGYRVYPFTKKGKNQLVSRPPNPKFYFFDIGVANFITSKSVLSSDEIDIEKSFKHFILLELIAAINHFGWEKKIEFWRTKQGLEIDFVVDNGKLAIDVKSGVWPGGLRAIKVFREEFKPQRSIVVTAEPVNRIDDGIEIMNYEYFLDELNESKLL